MIYDFYCKNCGKRRQVEIRLADYDKEKDRQKCPKCGEKIERVIEWQSIHRYIQRGIKFQKPKK